MVKLRKGLRDPLKIPAVDVPFYMATTYSGYMTEIQQRLYAVDQIAQVKNVSRSFSGDFIFLQARHCCELFAYALSSYAQNLGGPIGKNKRTENDPSKVVSSIQDTTIWVKPVANASNEGITILELDTPMCPPFSNPRELHRFNGRLGDQLHAKQRPRPDDTGRLTPEEVYETLFKFKTLINQHIVGGKDGAGWVVDTHREFRFPVEGPDNLVDIRFEIKSDAE